MPEGSRGCPRVPEPVSYTHLDVYKRQDFYHPGDDVGLLWSDPEIGVDWPIEPDMQLIISDKDRKWSGLKDTFKF